MQEVKCLKLFLSVIHENLQVLFDFGYDVRILFFVFFSWLCTCDLGVEEFQCSFPHSGFYWRKLKTCTQQNNNAINKYLRTF
jgi:hypothetical protein